MPDNKPSVNPVPPVPDGTNRLNLYFQWQNRKVFELKSDNAHEKIVIIRCEEDGNLPALWPNIEAVCKLYIQGELEKMGKEMRQV